MSPHMYIYLIYKYICSKIYMTRYLCMYAFMCVCVCACTDVDRHRVKEKYTANFKTCGNIRFTFKTGFHTGIGGRCKLFI